MYLTARHSQPMLPGTIKSLKALGFPTENIPLVLKKDLEVSDALYKSREVQSRKNSFSKITFIDNEPVVLNQIKRDHPEVELVWVDSTHSKKENPPEGIPTIKDFLLN